MVEAAFEAMNDGADAVNADELDHFPDKLERQG